MTNSIIVVSFIIFLVFIAFLVRYASGFEEVICKRNVTYLVLNKYSGIGGVTVMLDINGKVIYCE